jgi:hypothetical protein
MQKFGKMVTRGEVMSDNNVPSHPLFSFYNDELETYLDKIDGDSLCLFDIVVDILQLPIISYWLTLENIL